MPKRKNLNGTPHNFTQSLFGTEYYYNGGYMGDWLVNAVRKLALKKVSLDVMTGVFSPPELNIRPLSMNAARLKEIIEKELEANGFPLDYITEARIDFEFPPYLRLVHCYPFMVDSEGRRYQPSKPVIEQAYEKEFDPFDERNIYPMGKPGNLPPE